MLPCGPSLNSLEFSLCHPLKSLGRNQRSGALLAHCWSPLLCATHHGGGGGNVPCVTQITHRNSRQVEHFVRSAAVADLWVRSLILCCTQSEDRSRILHQNRNKKKQSKTWFPKEFPGMYSFQQLSTHCISLHRISLSREKYFLLFLIVIKFHVYHLEEKKNWISSHRAKASMKSEHTARKK